MTLEEKLKVCLNCDNRKFDMKRGTVCKLTDEKPTFEDSCPDYKGSTNQKSSDNSYQNYEPEFGGWLKFMMVIICVGVALSIIQNINDLKSSAYDTYVVAFVIAHCLSFTAMAGYAIYCFIRKKANAVFWGYAYFTYCLLTNLFIICFNGESNLVLDGVRALVTCVAWMFFLHYSDNVNELFPKDKRTVKKHDWILAINGILIPYIVLFSSLASTAEANEEAKYDTTTMIETYTEDSGYYTDGITAFKIPTHYDITKNEEDGLTFFRIVDNPDYSSETITIASEYSTKLSQSEFQQYVDGWTNSELEQTSHSDKYEETTIEGKHMHYHQTYYEEYNMYWELAVISDPDIDKNFLVSIYTQEPGTRLYFFARNVKFE